MIPDFMDFRLARTRGALARLIGNAVPPSLSMAVTELALPLLDGFTAKGEAAEEHGRRRRGVPKASTEVVARRMRSTRQRDTAAERRLQQALDEEGLHYELDRAPISSVRTRADVVFADAHVAVYLDGCFWHGCPEHGTWPKANAEWWREKLDANRRRDAVASKILEEAGWRVLRFWAHEPVAAAARTIAQEVRRRSASNRTGAPR
jgi:DNA mismatch endonuclease, patch repair protein